MKNSISVLFISNIILGGLIVCGCSSKKVTAGSDILKNAQSEKIIAEFDIPKSVRHITVPVKVAGKEYLFLLDTGATHWVFDETLRSYLGKAITTQDVGTAGGATKLAIYYSPEAFLGEIRLKEQSFVTCFDLKKIRQASGLDIYGIVGMSTLWEYVVQIDFQRGKLRLIEPTITAHSEWGQYVPILPPPSNRRGLPMVRGVISESIEDVFIVDTGTSGTGSLRKDIFDRVVKDNNLNTFEVLVDTASGTVRARKARIPQVSVGDIPYRDLMFCESNKSRLGLDWLSRFRVTFDFPRRKMYLKKAAGFERYEETDMSELPLR